MIEKYCCDVCCIDLDVFVVLFVYDYLGNVCELKNAFEHVVIMVCDGVVCVVDFFVLMYGLCGCYLVKLYFEFVFECVSLVELCECWFVLFEV